MVVLNARKFKILRTIINDYIETAEPIGSRTIAKKYDIGVSSATIRNEMSDLEDMGLINQLHTSSGRVPSEKGYRYYVDQMMERRVLTAEEAMFLQQMLIDNITKTEVLVQTTAKALSKLTNYPAVVSEPQMKKTKIKHVQLVPLDDKSILLVLVTDKKTVKNQVVALEVAPGYEVLTKLTRFLNNCLSGLTVKEIDRRIISELLALFEKEAHVLLPILGVIADMISSLDDVRVYTSGVKNILAFPEFSDIRKAEAIVQAFEDRQFLFELLEKDGEGDIQIVIGGENSIDLLKACSLIKSDYTIDNQSTGRIALVGPMRMDYSQAVSILYGILHNMKVVINALGLTEVEKE